MKKYILIFWATLIFAGCEIINPDEPIPAYIYVESFDFVTDPDQEGSNASKITDVWLFNEGDFLGAFPLPATIPILKTGLTSLTLKPGIKDNGINSTPDIYPFYEPFQVEIDLKEGKIDSLHASTKYTGNTKFGFIESFESGVSVFNEIRIGAVENRVTLSEEDVFEGNKSGLIQLDTTNNFVELATGLNFSDLTDTGLKVYLEVNFKTDVPVFFGLIGYDASNPSGKVLFQNGVSETQEWKKIYFNLSSVAIIQQYDFYKVGLQAFIPKEEGKFTLDKAQIHLDNIKLLHY